MTTTTETPTTAVDSKTNDTSNTNNNKDDEQSKDNDGDDDDTDKQVEIGFTPTTPKPKISGDELKQKKNDFAFMCIVLLLILVQSIMLTIESYGSKYISENSTLLGLYTPGIIVYLLVTIKLIWIQYRKADLMMTMVVFVALVLPFLLVVLFIVFYDNEHHEGKESILWIGFVVYVFVVGGYTRAKYKEYKAEVRDYIWVRRTTHKLLSLFLIWFQILNLATSVNRHFTSAHDLHRLWAPVYMIYSLFLLRAIWEYWVVKNKGFVLRASVVLFVFTMHVLYNIFYLEGTSGRVFVAITVGVLFITVMYIIRGCFRFGDRFLDAEATEIQSLFS